MICPRDDGSRRRSDCGGAVPEQDPLVGWWFCDDSTLAIADAGEVYRENSAFRLD